MSQLQFQCPASPMPAASAPLQLGQPQPGYSIPCASGTLPSESASQPIRSSALPAGSATPYNTTTGMIYFVFKFSIMVCKSLQCVFVRFTLCISEPFPILCCLWRSSNFCSVTVSNMANPKEKTPMCLVNELARFNKIQPEYKLLCEQGPAHSKVHFYREGNHLIATLPLSSFVTSSRW